MTKKPAEPPTAKPSPYELTTEEFGDICIAHDNAGKAKQMKLPTELVGKLLRDHSRLHRKVG
jgi:hypothetical protein